MPGAADARRMQRQHEQHAAQSGHSAGRLFDGGYGLKRKPGRDGNKHGEFDGAVRATSNWVKQRAADPAICGARVYAVRATSCRYSTNENTAPSIPWTFGFEDSIT